MSNTPIGLALGSGAARGMAHIGVLKALKEAEIPIHAVSGTSSGALVGAAYVSGKLDEIEEFALNIDWRVIASYCDFVFPRKGLLEGTKITTLLNQIINQPKFEELLIKFAVVATDLHTGEEIVFTKGNVTEAVRASISLPGIFEPVLYQNRLLVDGGLVNPVPVNVARNLGAEKIIAVDLTDHIEQRNKPRRLNGAEAKRKVRSDKLHQQMMAAAENDQTATNEDQLATLKEHWVFRNLEQRYRRVEQQLKSRISAITDWKEEPEEDQSPSLFDVMANTINIMSHQIAGAQLREHKPDVIIKPKLGYVGLFDYQEAEDVMRIGYEQTMRQMSEIENLF